jgi:hypothetical protein
MSRFYVGKAAFFKSILLAVILCRSLASAAQTRANLASVSTVTLAPDRSLNLQPRSDVGIILVAIDTCLLRINNVPVTLEPGQRKFVHGPHAVTVTQDATSATSLVIVNVANASQELTFDRTELTPANALEDASSRNDTLLIALSPLKLQDRIDRADEGEHAQWGSPRMIELERGQFTWIEPGMHQVRNRGDASARFLTVEW